MLVNFYITNRKNNFLNKFRSENKELFWKAVDAVQAYRKKHDKQNASRLLAFAGVCDVVICSHKDSGFKERLLKNPEFCLKRIVQTNGLTCI